LADIKRVFRKVRKTQLEFRPKPGEIRGKKTPAQNYIRLQGGRGVKLKNEPFFFVEK
jgi:hypothetical protein